MKFKLLGLILLSVVAVNAQAQSSDKSTYESSAYAKKFAKDSAKSSHKNNNAFSKGYTNKYDNRKPSATHTCKGGPKTKCDYEK